MGTVPNEESGRSLDHMRLFRKSPLFIATRVVTHPQMVLFVQGVSQRDGRSYVLGSWPFSARCVPHCSLAATSS